MKAITFVPGKANSAALQDVPEPPQSEGDLLIRSLALGICGTDFELVYGEYSFEGNDRPYLVLGHESLGQVLEAPPNSGFSKDDLVVGIVRRPDPVPCRACAVNQWDMCLNGKYTERGIKERDGFGSERFRNESQFTVKLDPKLGSTGVLIEPTSVVAKAWDHITRIGERAVWKPQTVLVTGAGPIGLLAAMIGKQRGLEVHVLDKVESGLKPQLVHELGGEYHTGKVRDLKFRPDIILECTGVCDVIVDCLWKLGGDGVLCLAGVSSKDQRASIDIGDLNRQLVLENGVVFGSVNANRGHYEAAAEALLAADRDWVNKLITRRVPVDNWREALKRQPDDIKVVVEFQP